MIAKPLYKPISQQQQQTPHLLQTSSSKSGLGSTQEVFSEEPYKSLELALNTLVNKLEVLCQLVVDFENLNDNGFDLLIVVNIQGRKNYFDCLQGPVLFPLVREFWTYAMISVQVTSFVMGNLDSFGMMGLEPYVIRWRRKSLIWLKFQK